MDLLIKNYVAAMFRMALTTNPLFLKRLGLFFMKRISHNKPGFADIGYSFAGRFPVFALIEFYLSDTKEIHRSVVEELFACLKIDEGFTDAVAFLNTWSSAQVSEVPRIQKQINIIRWFSRNDHRDHLFILEEYFWESPLHWIYVWAMIKMGLTWYFLDNEMKVQHPEILIALVEKETFSMYDVPIEMLLSNPEIIRTAARHNNPVFPDYLCQHLEFCLIAVKENGMFLKYCSKSVLQQNPDIIVAALKQNGDAFQFVPKSLQSESHVAEKFIL